MKRRTSHPMFEDCPELEPKGRYIVTPDSTPPVATTLFDNMSAIDIQSSATELNDRADRLGLSPANAFFYFTPEEKARLGHTATRTIALMKQFDVLAKSNGGAEIIDTE